MFKLLSGNFFFKKNCLNLKNKNIFIGRFIVAETCKNPKTLYSKIYFIIFYLINLYKAGIILNTCEYYENKINAIYIDHCGYLKGIFYSYFGQKKKYVYTNNYPYSIFQINFKKKKNFKFHNFEEILKIPFYKEISSKKRKISKNLIFKMSKNPKKYLPWMRNTKFIGNRIRDINKFEYLIYCHSFTDAQLWFGNDGFCNTYDWLKFTLKKLNKLNKKVLIKSHPNYFNKWMGIRSYHDKYIFNLLMEKYKNNKNFRFINTPVNNYDLMKNLNKKCILITHHGTVINETLIHNLKSIASSATFWKKDYKISNIWNNKKEYENILNKKWDKLMFNNNNHLLTLFYNFYFHKYSYHGNNYWQKIISKSINLNFIKFNKKIENNFYKLVPKKKYLSIISKIENSIMKI